MTTYDSEKAFMAAVIELAQICGWKCYHTHDSRKSEAGFPDLFLCHEQRHKAFALELKLKRRPTQAQSAWIEALNRCGIDAFWATPAQMPEIERLLTGANSK
jgi:hypothetical protein